MFVLWFEAVIGELAEDTRLPRGTIAHNGDPNMRGPAHRRPGVLNARTVEVQRCRRGRDSADALKQIKRENASEAVSRDRLYYVGSLFTEE